MKKSSNFYGSKIEKGELHKKMGIKKGEKIPAKKENSEISTLKNKKNKSASDVKKERELVFAKNARKFKH